MNSVQRCTQAARSILVAYLSMFLVVGAWSQQRPRTTQQAAPAKKTTIAVLDFDARGGLTKEEAATLSDAFQTELVTMGEFIVVDRQRIRQILEEQGFQQSEACSQVECIVEAGKILKVERMFAGVIGKVGSLYNVNIQVIDITTAQIISNKSRQHRGDIEELLSDIIPEMAAEMASELTGRKFERASGGGGWLWYAAGAVVVGGGAAAALLLSPKKTAEQTTKTTALPSSPDFP